MPTPDTRNRKEAEKSNVVKPTNPLFPFDKCVYKMLKSLYDEVYVIDTFENAFQINAKAHSGKIVLPMITVYRLADYTIAKDMINDVAVRSGYRTTVQGKAEFENRRIARHVLPVTLTYQIDIWATRRDVAEGITAELLMEFNERPHVSAKLQDMGTESTPVEFDFQVDDNVVDNSSITEFDDTGRFYRLTLNGIIPSAMISRVDIFSRIDKETIDFKDFSSYKEAGIKIPTEVNKIHYEPDDRVVGENLIDEFGLYHGETIEDEIDHIDNPN